MNNENDIHYLRRSEIDTGRWDACVASAQNSLLYGFHFYLDAMADGQWDALVLGDYTAVMPLPWRRKSGFTYLYQPAFTQQTGIFSRQTISAGIIGAFLQQLRIHFRFAEIYLNYACGLPGLEARVNYILPLEAAYDTLAGQYKRGLVYTLKQAETAGLSYHTGFDLTTALVSYRLEYAARLPYIRESDYGNFQRLCLLLAQREQVVVRAVTGHQEKILATAVLLRDDRRLYLIHSTTPPGGRQAGANHFLLDRLIREFAGNRLILDFEGSDVPGIASFYNRFGSKDQPYFFYRFNRLPWPLKLLK
jgi:hypothetical protein